MATAAVVGSVPERQREQAARPQQAHELAERARSVEGCDVLPDGAQRHEIGSQAEPGCGHKPGQAVWQPADPGRGVPPLGLGAHARRRLHGDHIVAHCREGTGVAASARAHVHHQCRRRWQQVG